ncbi:MAG TPA: adenylate/guanylate cyclase domain-containing protein [Candidatus Binatia bacterium]|nr:adenylate/guanylate cyclase domain-containing protein [Candidatus Binatia bacterium]
MRCPACGFEAPEALRFCGRCGTRLPAACPACRHENPPDFRFCGACGVPLDGGGGETGYTPRHLAEKILTGRALEGERKQVTVLFADVAGFTALAERLDPEEVHGIMDRCFRLLGDEVHRYEGTINQYTGDGIMALFGAPIAHENAPERAVRAALDMQAALRRYGEDLARTHGLSFRMRIGIHTGPVVVGRIGDDLRMDYTAIGDTTNLAARLQAAAEPGTILVSAQTAQLVAGRFALRPVGPLRLKGKAAPIAAAEVVRALPRAPLVATPEEGLTPLVGRTAELAALETRFADVAGGRGQVVYVVGDAGIGKSRLLHEFRRRLAGEDIGWLAGRCVSFGREMPFLPIIDALKGGLGIDEGDGEAAIVEKLRRGLGALDADLAGTEPYLRALLAVDPGDPAVATMDASARRFTTFEAVKRLALGAAARRPLVIVVEDLHWIDPASDDFLAYVADALATARVLLLCTYRPGYRPALAERSYVTRLALQPLTPAETTTLAGAILEASTFPAEIRDLIAAKAEGNPFFIEEVTKSLREIGALRRSDGGWALGIPANEIVIPDRIQDVIMARIDRLGDAPKRAIQIASVIGREFAVRLLQRAADLGTGVDALVGELRALELIYEKSGVPELAYMFKHALTHDVAYESLLVQRRKELHRLIGAATEELYADRLPEYWETLAHHFLRGEDWPRALAYLAKAGDKARAAFANREALYFYGHALAVAARLGEPPPRRAALLEGKGDAHFRLSEFPEAVAAYREARALIDDPRRAAHLDAALADALMWAHEFDAAVTAAGEAVALAGSAGEPVAAAHATYVVGFVEAVRGRLDEAVTCIGEATRLAETAGDRALAARARAMGALGQSWRGDYAPAIRTIEEAVAHEREMNELLWLAEATSHLAIALGGAGEYGRALALLDEGIARSESIGDRVWRARMWNTRGWILGELGAFAEAEAANHRCLELARQLGPLRMAPELTGNADANLADLALVRGDLVGAEPHLAAVAAVLGDRRNEWMTWRYGMHFRAAAAELAVARGDLGRAREHLGACLATAERTGSRRYLVRARRLLAGCLLAAGRASEAEALLAGVVAAARQLGNPPQLWHVLVAYGRVLHALGRRDEAAAAWREAAAAVAAIRAALPAHLAAALAASPLAATLGELGA